MLKILKTLLFCLLLFLVGCTKEKDITITLNFNNANLTETIPTKANLTIELPTPTKEGYTFSHWYDLNGNKYQQTSSFNADITIYANWVINEYMVKFYNYDDTLLSEQKVKYKKAATAPSELTRLDYVFIGWDQNFSSINSDINIYAQYEEATEGLVYQLETDGYSITGYQGTNKEVIIPSQYKGYPVTSIAPNAFKQKLITTVTLPNTIKLIGYQAFYECGDLININIPTSVEKIDDEAFMNCVSLAKITIPTPIIGKAAFYNCSALSDITILDTVTTILEAAFYNCSRLITLYLPESVTTVGSNVISWCQNLEYIYTTAANVTRLKNMFTDAGYIYAKKLQFAAKEQK